MTQEQRADLQKYIPASDMVKMVFNNMHPTFEFQDWDKAVFTLADRALTGDKDALMDLLELTYLNAHNEGVLEANDEIYNQECY
jgi:hypothetical protein